MSPDLAALHALASLMSSGLYLTSLRIASGLPAARFTTALDEGRHAGVLLVDGRRVTAHSLALAA